MRHIAIEQILIAATPAHTPDKNFTNVVMSRIDTASYVRPAKRGLFTQFKHLPRFAVAIIAVAMLALVSGSTYAVVTTLNQPKVEVKQSSVNESGRRQFDAEFTGCETQKNNTTYEIKKGSTLTDDDIAKTLQARCEMDAIQAWITLHNSELTKDYPNSHIGSPYFFSSTIIGALTEKDVTFTNEAGAYSSTYQLAGNTKFFVDGIETGRSALQKGDAILPIVRFAYDAADKAKPAQVDVTALFKLSLPRNYYQFQAQEMIDVRADCAGNPDVTCVSVRGSATIITYGGGMPNMQNTREMRVVQGTLTGMTATTLTIQTVPNNRTYTVAMPAYAVDTFNKTATAPVAIGDHIQVYYLEDANVHDLTIPYSSMTSISLMMERSPDLESASKY